MNIAITGSIESQENFIAGLTQLVGAENIIQDSSEIAVWCQDVYSSVPPCLAVVMPTTTDQVSAIAARATAAGVSLVPRGGGMSYTSGYLPDRPSAIIVDMSRMDRVVSVNLEDMVLTVETGCTWAAIKEALKGTGVRPPYWGPLSGLRSTVGGALSQNSIFFGAGLHGAAADSVVSLEVVLSDGSILLTGSAANQDGSPFFRHYGPDLTGLFTGDGGAFGLKTKATLRLIPEPPAKLFGSFSFEEADQILHAMAEVSRRGLASECYAFDPFLQEQRMKRESLAKDFKALAGVVTGGSSLTRGLAEGAKMVLAGRRFASKGSFSMHVSIEQTTEEGAAAALKAVRAIVKQNSGVEIENTIPKVVYAMPFTPPNSMIGPSGERWVPVHGILPHSKAVAVYRQIEALKRERAADIEKYEIGMGSLLTTIGCSATLIEPVFYWPDALMEMHRRHVEDSVLSKIDDFAPNDAARAMVHELRGIVAEIFRKAGATHFQIAKSYPYKEGMRPEAWALLEAIKNAVDPARLMNPGCLGLE
jgi:FAD/FMN-containing dehydrogenase